MPPIQFLFAILLIIACELALAQGRFGSRVRPRHRIQDKIIEPLSLIDSSQLPREWDWSRVNGSVNFLTMIRNQHIPRYCGACWAFAATSVISDRIKIMRNAQWYLETP